MAKNKNLRTLIILFSVIILLLALYFTISAVQNANDKKKEENEAQENAYIYVDRNDIDKIDKIEFSVNSEGFSSLVLEKNGDEIWLLDGKDTLSADSAVIKTSLAQFELVLAIKEINDSADSSDMSEYGLKKPSYTLTLHSGSSKKSYFFGDFIESKGLYYMTPEGSDDIYLVERQYADAFYLSASDILVRDLFFDIKEENILSFTLIRGENSSKFTAADGENFENLCDSVNAILLGEFVGHSEKAFEIFGFGGEKEVTVLISHKGGSDGEIFESAFKLALGETDDYIYIRVGDTLFGGEHTFSDKVYLVEGDKTELVYESFFG